MLVSGKDSAFCDEAFGLRGWSEPTSWKLGIVKCGTLTGSILLSFCFLLVAFANYDFILSFLLFVQHLPDP